MALVPIIYTSLLIFIGLLIFVIGVSYILFKTKDKSTRPVEFREIRPNSFDVRPANYNFNKLSVRPVSIQYRHSLNYTKVNNVEEKSRENSRNSLPITIQNETINDYHLQQTNKYLKVDAQNKFQEAKRINQKLTFSRNRIEILNNSVPFNNTSIESKFDISHNSIRSRNNISENNLFNYYSDVKDLDLIMLSPRNR